MKVGIWYGVSVVFTLCKQPSVCSELNTIQSMSNTDFRNLVILDTGHIS